jgi:pimeloyl-ACP methyl ester carboxylesterase
MAASGHPRKDASLTLSDGRTLAYAEWGVPDGTSLILLHGSPGSRLMCPDVDATLDAGVRLITVDRPGYGGSSPLPGRSVVDFVADLLELMEFLELARTPVVGWSGGGPYAVAAAWAAPDRFPRIGLVASPGPEAVMPQEVSRRSDEARSIALRLGAGDESAVEEVRRHLSFYAENPLALLEQALAREENPDRHVLIREDVTDAFRTMWTEGARQGAEGLVSDWCADAPGWGFSLSEVRNPVHVWHGEADGIVPQSHARFLADGLPQAVLVLYPGEGHSIAIAHWDEVLAATI